MTRGAFAFLVWLLPALAVAGEIRGTITDGGKPIGAGVGIDVQCGEQRYSTTTDKYGAYRLFVPEKGKCQLSVAYQNQTPSREIVSFDDSARYDMVLDKDGGQYVLRRK
ncbi:carboxypeptidase-like regulatory domain-containing protein [Candidatus Nitrospira bockiana]